MLDSGTEKAGVAAIPESAPGFVDGDRPKESGDRTTRKTDVLRVARVENVVDGGDRQCNSHDATAFTSHTPYISLAKALRGGQHLHGLRVLRKRPNPADQTNQILERAKAENQSGRT
jgi:hypothetical protein